MSIVDKIDNALRSINIPSFHVTKKIFDEECIVYSYISNSGYSADNENKCNIYTVLINIYTNEDNVETKKGEVIKLMSSNGFKFSLMAGTIDEKNGLFNTAIQFKTVI